MKAFLFFVALTFGTLALAGEPDITSMYEVSTTGSSTALKAGEKGTVAITIKAKNGAHVSDEAPLRIELSSKESKLEKQKLTLTDSLSKKVDGQYMDAQFQVGFTPSAQGKTTVEAKLTFFICTEKLCSRQTKNLTFPVDVR